jgi:hypothetical protein
MDLDAYRTAAEAFVADHTREYHRHFAGLQDELGIEAVYARHAGLFTRAAVEELRSAVGTGPVAADEARRRRYLLDFAVDGLLGRATRTQEAELARREAELSLEVDGERTGFRESAIEQANEPDGGRRERIETARLAAIEEQLNPLHAETLEIQHALSRDLGWRSYSEMCAECKGIDLTALERETAAFSAATEAAYPGVVDEPLRRAVGVGLGAARRADLPRFFRCAEADARFPAASLVPALRDTLAGLGIALDAQGNVLLDIEPRPKKSPRAFCAPVRVPHEVHLVVPPMGGRDDYVALFHEAGHAEHYAHADAGLAFEFRVLGDNSVTEGFAFLFDHLVEDPEWLRRHLGGEPDPELAAHVRAVRLLFVRRYAAKLGYELELHGGARPAEELAEDYAARLSAAVGVPWPSATYLADVDPGFYAAAYLRAWALETHLRESLRTRFGPAWFAEPEAGAFLRELWREGQRLDAAELLAEVIGPPARRLDFDAMVADLGLEATPGPSRSR